MGQLLRRALWMVTVSTVGTVLLVAGIVMLITPGPGLLLILLGVGVLALQFRWAERLVRRLRDRLGQLVPDRHRDRLERLGLIDAEPEGQPTPTHHTADPAEQPARERAPHAHSGGDGT